jgi:membrane protease subunit HflC
MQTERQREAAEFRAWGAQRAQEIRARADREVTILVADATARAEQTRGEGDAERNRIFAEAFNRDRDFFAFYRSMQAYEAGLGHNDTRMLLKPDSDFFRFFVNPTGKREAQATPAQQPAATPSPPAAPPVPAPSTAPTQPGQQSPIQGQANAPETQNTR